MEDNITAQTPSVNPTTPVTPLTEVKTLLEWVSPARVFFPKGKKYFSNLGLIILIAGIVLIFFKEFTIVVVILALAFVSYALSTVPPERLKHKITTQGLVSGEHSYFWKDLKDFWVVDVNGVPVLQIDTNLRFPGRLFLLIEKPADKDLLVKTLSAYLPFVQQPKGNVIDVIAEKASTIFNLK